MGPFQMKKVNNVKIAYFSQTHFILTPGYLQITNFYMRFQKNDIRSRNKKVDFFH